MKTNLPTYDQDARRQRRIRVAGAILVLVTLPLTMAGACDDAISKEFRSAALPTIESGVKAVFTGVLTGIFTVADPNASSSSTSSSSTGTTGGTSGTTGTTGSTTGK